MIENQSSLFDGTVETPISVQGAPVYTNQGRQSGKTHAANVAMAFFIEPGRYFMPNENNNGLLFLINDTARPNGQHIKEWKIGRFASSSWRSVFKIVETIPNREYTFISTGTQQNVAMFYDCIEKLFKNQICYRLAWAQQTEMCSECGRELRLPRSRHYAIGPECEKDHPERIAEVDQFLGYTWREISTTEN